jgi:SPP1 family predicted phage head-tail adaptor
MPINAGQLDKQVIIQSVTHTTGADGSRTDTWADVATVWVRFMEATSREFLAAQQVNADVTHMMSMRTQSASDAGLSASHRFKFGTRIMNMAGPPNDVGEHGEEMLVSAIEEF